MLLNTVILIIRHAQDGSSPELLLSKILKKDYFSAIALMIIFSVLYTALLITESKPPFNTIAFIIHIFITQGLSNTPLIMYRITSWKKKKGTKNYLVPCVTV